jgi:vacuolar-type H+-ATPase subunit I/STV1
MRVFNTSLDTATSKRDRPNTSNASELATDAQRPADPFVEPLSLLSCRLSDIATSIVQLERSHFQQMENAIAQLRDQIAADLQNRYQDQFETGIQVFRDEYEERIRSATALWECERRSLLNEMEHLRHRNPPELAGEIAQSEAALEAIHQKIQAMLDDPTVELSRAMQEKARQQELEAYLKGLKFKA